MLSSLCSSSPCLGRGSSRGRRRVSYSMSVAQHRVNTYVKVSTMMWRIARREDPALLGRRPDSGFVEHALEPAEVLPKQAQDVRHPVGVAGVPLSQEAAQGNVGQSLGDLVWAFRACSTLTRVPERYPVRRAQEAERGEFGIDSPARPGADRLRHEIGERAERLATCLKVLLGQGVRQRSLTREEQTEALGGARDTLGHVRNSLAQSLVGQALTRGAQAAKILSGLDRETANEDFEQLVLALDVVVDRSPGQADCVGEILQRGARDAVLGEQALGSLHELPHHHVVAGGAVRPGLRHSRIMPGAAWRQAASPLYISR